MKAFLLVILLSSGDDVLSLHSSLNECLQAERMAYTLEQSTAAMQKKALQRAAATL